MKLQKSLESRTKKSETDEEVSRYFALCFMITSQFVRISNQEAIVPAKTSVTISTFVMVSLILFATLASAQVPTRKLALLGWRAFGASHPCRSTPC